MPRRRDLLAIFVCAILLRLVCLAVMGREQGSIANLPFTSDGSAYNGTAMRINGDGMPDEYDRRVFVGLPWVIATLHRTGLPYGVASQGVCLLCAGLLCAATAAWLRDRRIGWALAVLPPHWVLDSSAVLNESMMLLACVGGMWALTRSYARIASLGLVPPPPGEVRWGPRPPIDSVDTKPSPDAVATDSSPQRTSTTSTPAVSAASAAASQGVKIDRAFGNTRVLPLVLAVACFAFAGFVRPMACFAVLGGIAMLLTAGRRRDAVVVAAGTLLGVTLLLGAFAIAYWNPLSNVAVYRDHPAAYGGEMLTWPFHSFVRAALDGRALRPAFLYKLGYVIAAIAIAGLAIVAWRRTCHPLDAMAAAWWTTNTAFALCIGSHWGVDIAHRSVVWALPAGFWVVRAWLPTRWYWRLTWALLAPPLVWITSQI